MTREEKKNLPVIENGLLVKMREAGKTCICRVSRTVRRQNKMMVYTNTVGEGAGHHTFKKDFWEKFAPLEDGDIETLPEWAKTETLVTYSDIYGRDFVGRIMGMWLGDNGQYKLWFEGCTPQDYRNGVTAYVRYTELKPLENIVTPRFKKGDRVRIIKNGHTGMVTSTKEEIPGTRYIHCVNLDEPVVSTPYCDWYQYVSDEELETVQEKDRQ